MFIIHLDSQAEMQLLVLEKIWERYSAPKFEQKATPVAGKLDCYWALNFERKEQLLIFGSFYRKHAKHRSPGY